MVATAAGFRILSPDEAITAVRSRAPLHAAAVLDFPLDVSAAESISKRILDTLAPKAIVVIEKGRPGRGLLYDREHSEGRSILNEGEMFEDAYGLELADFARAVLHGTELAAGPEESLGELRTALAMYRSAGSRQWEKVWD